MPDTFTTSAIATSGEADAVVLGLFGAWRSSPSMTVPVAERVRFALMRASGARVPWQISGKSCDGDPRVGHDHLFVLPFASTAEGSSFDRVLLWARFGLEPDTLAVIEQIRARGARVQLGSRPPLRLEVLGPGARAAFSSDVARRLLGPARVWQSATPFIAPRHTKRRRSQVRDTPSQQLESFCATLLGRAPICVESVPEPDCRRAETRLRAKDPRWLRRVRPTNWRLVFSEPVRGPIALGHAAHFGLGRFEALDQP